MDQTEVEILNDFKAYINRSLIEGNFETAIMTIGQDCSDIMLSGTKAKRLTAGEHGRISLSTQIPRGRILLG